MKISKITNGEFAQNSISSLPIRPNESSRYGKAALSGEELKSMFDKNAELLRSRINSIIDYISGEGELGIASEIMTGIPDMPTLASLCDGIQNGALAATLTLTEEYTLLDFATKLMHFVSPETAVEFIKIEKKDGVYTLPDAPYPQHEKAIYILPSSDSLSIFDCYVWNEGWQIWSTGSLQSYIGGLEEKLNELYSTAARVSELNYVKSIKADDADVISLTKKIDAMCAGTPIVFPGSYDALCASLSSKTDRIYLLKYNGDPYDGYWFYHDGSSWVAGGKYLADSGTVTDIQKYDNSPVSSGAVKEYVDKLLDDAFDGVARNYSGSLNLFDKNAVMRGKINSSGAFVEDENFIITDYIDITALYDIYVSCTSSDGYPRSDLEISGYMLYTYEKTPLTSSYIFLNSALLPSAIPINRTTYPNARKIRIVFKRALYNSVTKIMISSGTTAKTYQPYVRYVMKIDSKMEPDSELPVTNKALCEYITSKTHSARWIFGDSAAYPVFDTVNNKLIFNPDSSESEWGILLDGEHYHFQSGTPLEIDISPAATPDASGRESNEGVIYLNTEQMKYYSAGKPTNFADCFSVRDDDYAHSDPNALPIATFKRGETGFCAWMDCPYYIDGKLYGVSYDAQSIDERLGVVQDSVSSIRSDVESISDSVDSLSESCDSLNQGLGAVDSVTAELYSKVDELDTTVGSYDTRIANAEARASEASDAVNNLSNYYYTYDATSTFHMNTMSQMYIDNAKMICSFNKYQSSSGEYSATFVLSDMIQYNTSLFLTIRCPSCTKAPTFIFYDYTYNNIAVKYAGDHCENGIFTPQANTEYTLNFWYQNYGHRCHVTAFPA